ADAAPVVGDGLNQALRYIRIGDGGADIRGGVNTGTDPGFVGASTGMEVSISLAELGYTGGDLEAMAFISQGNHNRLNNQILAPVTSFPDGTVEDYRQLSSGMQFASSAYPGNQYFTISVPEPATFGLAALSVLPLLRRRQP
ncbi:MAG: hypothetical protein JWM57_2408, partial [Phycisphaerales bacterium]|nr:hypothetical protein [Phycisphaerales bacterium]